MNNEANDIEKQYEFLSCKSRLFESNEQRPFTRNSQNFISEDIWSAFIKEFSWLLVDKNIIKCKICKDGFNKSPEKIDLDEWISDSNDFSPSYNRDTLLMILKFHQFSDNHINSLKTLKLDTNVNLNGHSSYKLIAPAPFNDNHRTYNLVPIAPNNEININHGASLTNKPNQISSNIWSRYLSVYRWLYIRSDNMPGCNLCEEASEISGRMARTRWTDPTGQIPPTVGSLHVNTDRPQRTLNQHNHSSNHRLAEEILGRNNLLLEISRAHLPPNYRLKYPPVFTDEDWANYCGKYPWLYYSVTDDGYHCVYCEQAFSVYPTRLKSTSWTSKYGNSREKIDNRLRARKSLSEHQRSLNHNIAEELLRYSGKSALQSPPIHQDDTLMNFQQTFQSQNKDNINTNSNHTNPAESDSDISDSNKIPSSSNNHTNGGTGNTSLLTGLPLYGAGYEEYSEEPVVPIDTTLWFRLRQKYYWLQGDNGKNYGCSVCQTAYSAHSSLVSPTNWTRGLIPFSQKSKYMHLRKKFYQHSGCRKHLECEKLLVINRTVTIATTTSTTTTAAATITTTPTPPLLTATNTPVGTPNLINNDLINIKTNPDSPPPLINTASLPFQKLEKNIVPYFTMPIHYNNTNNNNNDSNINNFDNNFNIIPNNDNDSFDNYPQTSNQTDSYMFNDDDDDGNNDNDYFNSQFDSNQNSFLSNSNI